MSNSGPGPTTSGSITTYDTLPRTVRHWLADANYDWSPEKCRDALIKLDGESWELIEHMQDLEYRMERDHYAILASGKPYPK